MALSELFPWNILEGMTKRPTMVTHIWMFGRHFLQNKQNGPVTLGGGGEVVFVAKDKPQSFDRK